MISIWSFIIGSSRCTVTNKRGVKEQRLTQLLPAPGRSIQHIQVTTFVIKRDEQQVEPYFKRLEPLEVFRREALPCHLSSVAMDVDGSQVYLP